MKQVFLLLLLCLCACSRNPHRYSTTIGLMGSVCRITFYTDKPAKEAAALLHTCTTHLQMLDSAFDFHNPQSFLNAINNNAGIAPVTVPENLQSLFKRALFLAKHTNGAFNPALGAVIRLWNIGFEQAAVPLPADIQQALSVTDYQMIQYENRSIFLSNKEMHCDLGAIVKGFAADEVAKILKANTIPCAVIDIGGTLTLIGSAPNSANWNIAIRDPLSPDNQSAVRIEIPACSVSTSGSYERFFEKDGICYHHIIDPATGYPVANRLRSVTIITESAADADALSTACFVLGYQASIPLLAAIPHTNAVFIFDDYTIQTTAGIEQALQIVNKKYRDL